MSSEASDDSTPGIAIVGMAGRFPGSQNIEEFWQLLRADAEAVLSRTRASSSAPPGSATGTKGLADPGWFDAEFFGFNAREAEVTDPQQRIFLECAWTALEHAGYRPASYQGTVGVYAGAGPSSYLLWNLASHQELLEKPDLEHLSTRVSRKLNLRGPSITVQTGNSTSLVATALAVHALLNYQCDMALAGGVSVDVPRPGNRADGGKVMATGAGVVVLKRLDDALADRDTIHAVIKGAAISHDGASKEGTTSSRVEGQARAIAEAHTMAEFPPETITYVETHGTTAASEDLTEIAALVKAFGVGTIARNVCALGSVKTRIGDLGAAAGIAGLIKTTLALAHGEIPASLSHDAPDIDNSPFYFNTTHSDWQTDDMPRRAGVSSFDLDGTNAHLVLEQAPVLSRSMYPSSQKLVALSARTGEGLERATDDLVRHLREHPEQELADVAHTLLVGRTAFAHRRMVVCQDTESAVQLLASRDPKRVFTKVSDPWPHGVAFMFGGQGTQYVRMGHDLYQSEPTFRMHADLCFDLLKAKHGLDLRHLVYPKSTPPDNIEEILSRTENAQPALFVIQYALGRMWMSWGVAMKAAIGHSVGEYVAATLAGVFSIEDALALLAARGKLVQALPPGAMLTIPLPEAEVTALLETVAPGASGTPLSLSAVNEASSCVVSGPWEAVDALQHQLASRGIHGRYLRTSHAFHSAMLDPVLPQFAEHLQGARLSPPNTPFISNVTGTWITAAEATSPAYWVRHLRETVRFADGLTQLLKDTKSVVLEVGPGRTLTQFARRHPARDKSQRVLSCLRGREEMQSDSALILESLGQLWLSGVAVDWARCYRQQPRRRVPLPTSRFERQHYWIDRAATPSSRLALRTDVANWFYMPSWKRSHRARLEAAASTECWLFFLDRCGLGRELATRLEREGHEIVTVEVGTRFLRHGAASGAGGATSGAGGARAYSINPAEPGDYDELFRDLSSRGKHPKRIVHAWSVTPSAKMKPTVRSLEEWQSSGLYGLLFLAHAWSAGNPPTDPENVRRLWVLSNRLQEVTGDPLEPEKALLLAPCEVIAQEYPNIHCSSVDVVTTRSESGPDAALIEQLLEELHRDASEPIVAYRGSHRWVQTVEPIQLHPPIDPAPRLTKNGVYLITGGLGKVELALAEYLTKTAEAKLVLTRDSAFPAREDWTSWLAAQPEYHPSSRTIRKLQELESLGSEVLVLHADSTDIRQMQAAVAHANERFGAIHGVIHSAGVVTGGMAPKTLAELKSALASKVTGAIVLDTVFEDDSLDFFVLVSPRSGAKPGIGHIVQSAANDFLDAFVHGRLARRHRFTTCIKWDVWQSEGIANGPEIVPHQAAEVFRRVLGSTLPHVLVSRSGDRSRWSAHESGQLQLEMLKMTTSASRSLVAVWQDLLGIRRDDEDGDAAGDPLIRAQLLPRIKKGLGPKSTDLSVPSDGPISEALDKGRDVIEKDEGGE